MIIPKNINFDFVPIATNVYREINLVNISPLTVAYCITWNSLTSKLVDLEKKPAGLPDTQNVEEVKTIVDESEPEINKPETEVLKLNPVFFCSHLLPRFFYLSLSTFQAPSVDYPSFNSNEDIRQLINLEELVPKMPQIKISKTDIKKTIFPLAINYYDCEEDLMNAYREARSSDVEDSKSVHNYAKVMFSFF